MLLSKMDSNLRTWLLWLITCGETHADIAYRSFFQEAGFTVPSTPPTDANLSREQRSGLHLPLLTDIHQTAAADFNYRFCIAYLLTWNTARNTSRVSPISPWIEHLPEFALASRQLIESFTSPPPAATYLREFGRTDFRPMQQEAIDAIRAGKNPFVLLPTGGGKSLCFQLPALAMAHETGRMTVVVSPLQALMIDQVQGLEQRDIEFATFINGTLSVEERSARFAKLRQGEYTLLYISPEALRSVNMATLLAERLPALWVVDEAHCISQWGHDFRTDYCYIPRLIDEIYTQQGYPLPKVALFTATATQEVQQDIRALFSKHHIPLGPTIKPATLERDNLRFSVVAAPEREKINHIARAVNVALAAQGSAIVYTTARNGTEQIALELRNRGITCRHFHAKIPKEDKQQILAEFKAGTLPVVVATTAFGMGIDYDKVRAVIHHRMSANLEGYIQESGRAGRDGDDALCLLLHDVNDGEKLFQLQSRNHLSQQDFISAFQRLCIMREQAGNDAPNLWVMAHDLVPAGGDTQDEEDEHEQRETKAQVIIHYLQEFGMINHRTTQMALINFAVTYPTVEAANAALTAYVQEHRIPAGRATKLGVLLALLHQVDRKRHHADEPYPLDLLAEQSNIPQRELPKYIHELVHAGVCSNETQWRFHLNAGTTTHLRAQIALTQTLLRAIIALFTENSRHGANSFSINQRALATRVEQMVGAITAGDATTVRVHARELRPLLRYLTEAGWAIIQRIDKDTVRVSGWGAQKAPPDLDAHFAQLQEILLTLFSAATKDAKGARLTSTLADLAKHTGYSEEDLDVHLATLRRLHLLTITDGPKLMEKAYQLTLLPHASVAAIERHYPQLTQHYAQQARRTHIMLQYCIASEEARQALVRDYFAHTAQEFDALHPELPAMLQPLTEADRKALIDPLNAVQSEIVTSLDPALLVLAGPGSGKTKTVVHRIAYLIKARRVAPQRIVALAFNRNAADELRQRLRHLIGADAFGVQISTFHSLALRLLGRTIGDEQQTQDWEHIIQRACELFTATNGASGAALYTQRLQILGDIEYVFVDEYQDVDAEMYRLIHLLTGKDLPPEVLAPRVNICVIGDDDQAIYESMGASTKYLHQFEADYGAKRFALTDNYRSTQNIVSVANTYITHNTRRAKQRSEEQVMAVREEDGDAVRAFICADDATVATAMVEQVQSRLANGTSPEDICLVAPEWNLLALARALLMEAGINTKELRSDIKLSKCLQTVLLRRFLHSHPDRVLAEDERIVEVFQTFFREQGRDLLEPTVAQLLAIARSVDEQRNTILDESSILARIPVADVLLALREYDDYIARDRNGAVAVSSIHSVKGLEFKCVLVHLGTTRSQFAQKPEEERRLVYVAMTRAKDSLLLFSATRPEVYKEAGLLPETLNSQTGTAQRHSFFRTMTPEDVYLGYQTTREQQPLIATLKEGEHLRILLESPARHLPILLPSGECLGALSETQSQELKTHFAHRSKKLASQSVFIHKIYHQYKADKLTGRILSDHFVVLPEIKYLDSVPG
ncbi:MAG: RecQ family ATP-dependent DNA helicase [Ktedonobacterales bacterium]|nr:RecQ family ATP-dependent DNA helicase [Ktedonobacterales bacterium]